MQKNYELRQNFGELVKKIRIARKLTQAKLAEIVDVEAKHISCIENGLSFPSADLLARLADAFDMQVYELFLFSKKPNILELKEELNKIINNANDNEVEKIYLYSKFVTAK